MDRIDNFLAFISFITLFPSFFLLMRDDCRDKYKSFTIAETGSCFANYFGIYAPTVMVITIFRKWYPFNQTHYFSWRSVLQTLVILTYIIGMFIPLLFDECSRDNFLVVTTCISVYFGIWSTIVGIPSLFIHIYERSVKRRKQKQGIDDIGL